MNILRTSLLALALVPAALFAAAPAQPAAPAFDSSIVSGLGARNIGSAAMSGRISSLDAVTMPDGKLTVWVGAASGGVWKSLDGATTFTPVFDDQPVQSIGAVEIDKRNPETVWVGTGEAWTRNSVSIGNGIYKTTDGGDTWQHLGLDGSERISDIRIDPRASDTVYACVTGRLWSDSLERGVYRTRDGGQTWQQVLKAPNASTGCASLSMDEKNPDVLYAALWDFRRKGWTFRSGGESPTAPSASALLVTRDGGQTWTEVTPEKNKGFAQKPYGRIAVNVAPSDSQRIYAFVESPQSALYVSDDGGATWEARDRSQWMVWRPFYFARMTVDPNNADRVFKDDGNLILSEDAGRSFSVVGGFEGMHGDIHDVWVNPQNSKHVVSGDDGGLWQSHDGGSKWWKGENLPLSQFYHVSVDDEDPYHVYGGLQDNSSWIGDSAYPGGITNSRWENMYGGDGFWMFSDPARPRLPLRGIPGRRHRAREQAHARDARHPAEGARRGEAALQLEHPAAPVAQRKGRALHGLAVPVPHARPGPDVGPYLAGPHDQRSAEATPGGNRRRHGGQLGRRDAHHDLLHQRIATGRGHDLGRHGRRQRAAHPRRRQDLDQPHRQPQGRAEGVVGQLGRGEPARRGHGLCDFRPAHIR